MVSIISVIAKTAASNTLVLWIRVLSTLVATVVATRFALQALGVEAFGVFAAVAALPLMVAFLTSAMSATTQRFLAIGLAKEPSDAQRAFNVSLGAHLGVAVLLVVAGETLGQWMISNVLQVPTELLQSAASALRLVVVASAIGAFLAPYDALLQSHNRFALFASLDVFRASAVLVGSWLLLRYDGDRLVAYAILQAGSTTVAVMIGAMIAALQFPESRMRLQSMFNLSGIKERWNLFSWTIFGALAAIARLQGLVVLANVLFGPSASAALGVGNQLIGALRQLSTAISQALTPQIYRFEGGGDRSAMVDAAIFSCKYSALVGSIVAVPLIVEVETILSIWLDEPPPGVAISISLLTVAFLVDQLSASMGVAHLAIGRIAQYQIVCGIIGLSVIPMGYLAGKLSGDLATILLALIATSGLISIMRVFLFEPHAPGVTPSWLKKVIAPTALTVAACSLTGTATALLNEPGFVRVIVTTIASSLVFVGVAYVLMEPREKSTMKALWLSLLARRFKR